MKLELGAGGRPTPGWTHLDQRPLPGIEIVDDAGTLVKVDDESCDAIRAAHLLEHFGRLETVRVLELWWRKLLPGGFVEIEVPNLEGHIRNWRAQLCTDERLVEALFGEQDYPGNYHKTMFTKPLLERALAEAGFRMVGVTDIGCVLVAHARR